MSQQKAEELFERFSRVGYHRARVSNSSNFDKTIKDTAPHSQGNDAQENHEKFLMKNIIAGMELRRDADVETIRKLYKQLEESNKKNEELQKKKKDSKQKNSSEHRLSRREMAEKIKQLEEQVKAGWEACERGVKEGGLNDEQSANVIRKIKDGFETFLQEQEKRANCEEPGHVGDIARNTPFRDDSAMSMQPQFSAPAEKISAAQQQLNPAAAQATMAPHAFAQQQVTAPFAAGGIAQAQPQQVAFQQPRVVQQPRGVLAAGVLIVYPVTGKPDYSVQWIEYLKSIGDLDKAKAIETQMKRKYAEAAAGGKRRKY